MGVGGYLLEKVIVGVGRMNSSVDCNNCAVLTVTADGLSVGRCYHYLHDGVTCPVHGDVRSVQERYSSTGKLTKESVLEEHQNLKGFGKMSGGTCLIKYLRDYRRVPFGCMVSLGSENPIGVSICCPQDNFSKSRGKAIAYGRALCGADVVIPKRLIETSDGSQSLEVFLQGELAKFAVKVSLYFKPDPSDG